MLRPLSRRARNVRQPRQPVHPSPVSWWHRTDAGCLVTTSEARYVVAHREMYTTATFEDAIRVLEHAGEWPR